MSAHALDLHIANHFGPGERVDLILELPRDLTAVELDKVQAELKGRGLELTAPIELGADRQWPDALRVQFPRPHRPAGTAVLPLGGLVIGALGAVGITGLLGWRIGDTVMQSEVNNG